jgi:hypothetical protein
MWQSKSDEVPLIARSLVRVLQQMLLELSVSFIIISSGILLLDLVYSMGAIIVVFFISTVSKYNEWQNFAIWRIGDLLLMDITKNSSATMLTLSFLISSIFFFLLTYYNETYNIENPYIVLLKLLTSSTITRTIIEALGSLPLIELTILRFFFILLLT